MIVCKQFDNGLRLILNKMEGFSSTSVGVMVKTGSINENEKENGISHFIEHVMFKGTKKRSAFEISDFIDRIGAQINAYTSKEMTCYYTKSTGEHIEDALEVLSDIFFDSKYDKNELDKEKGVIIEEINMCEDTPEDICFDLLAKSYYGESGLGQTILGSEKNIKSFTADDVKHYMKKYYTADNVVISIAGNLDLEQAERLVKDYFADRFTRLKSAKQVESVISKPKNLFRTKKIEQSHIGFAMKGFKSKDRLADPLALANIILGGGMSSRLFQKIREDLGLCYSVYSYFSKYKDNGVVEIYAGVNTASRDLAVNAIVDEVRLFNKNGVTEQEFLRAKEQAKSSLIFSRENVASQMMLYGKWLLYENEEYDFQKDMQALENIKISDVHEAIESSLNIDLAATATVGTKRSAIKIK